MKKITLLLLMAITCVFSAQAQFPEGFETAVPPTGWTSFAGTNGEGTTYEWESTTTAASGSAAAFVRYESVANSAEDWLVTPQFTPTAAGGNFLTFKQRQGYTSDYGTTYTVRVSTASQTTHADFTTIDTQAEGDFSTIYSTHNVDLSAYNGTPIYVAFVMTQNYGDNWYIDDVDLILDANAPDCATNPTPADAAVDVVVTDGNVTLSWVGATTGDAATNYELFFGTTSGALSSLGSLSDTTINITNTNFSTTYYWMIVPSNIGGSATGCAEWSFTTEAAPPPPANDDFANAAAVNCGDTVTGSTELATLDEDDAPDNGSSDLDAPNVWYTYTGSGTAEQVELDLCNSSFDTTILVYTGTSGNLTLVASNDDACSTRSKVTFSSDGTTTYYATITGYSSTSTGAYEMSVTCMPPAPLNDDCADAEALTLGTAATQIDTSGATDSGVAAASCGATGGDQDVWFTFVAPTSGEITVTSNVDTVVIYDACAGSEVACGAGDHTVTAGTTYYVRAYNSGVAKVAGPFTLTVSDKTLSTNVFDNGLAFSYYPNPVNNTLTLKAQKAISNVAVFNMLGQEVIRTAPNAISNELDMSNLQSGAYFVKVTIGEATETVKILKN